MRVLDHYDMLKWNIYRHNVYGPAYYFHLPLVGFILDICDPPSIQHILKGTLKRVNCLPLVISNLADNFDNYPKGDLFPKYGQDIWGKVIDVGIHLIWEM